MIRLSELKPNISSKITGFSEALSVDFINDLMDHGLIIGSGITIINKISDKIIISLGYSNLSIRIADAYHIFIDERT